MNELLFHRNGVRCGSGLIGFDRFSGLASLISEIFSAGFLVF